MARMVGLALVVLVGVAGAQDLAALLAQGQAGGLSLEQVVGALRQRGMLDQVSKTDHKLAIYKPLDGASKIVIFKLKFYLL